MLGQGIKETTATTGTGALALTAVSGFVRFSQWFADQDLVHYTIMSGADGSGGLLEWGIGTITTSTNTLSRDVVLGTFSGGTLNTNNPTALSLTGSNLVLCGRPAGGARPGLTKLSSSNSSSGVVLPYPNTVNGSPGAAAVVADRLYLIPFELSTPKKLQGIKSRISTGGGSTVQFGLYACKANGEPGKLIASSGDIVSPGSGVFGWTLGTPKILPEDWYYFGFACKGGTPTLNTFVGGAAAYLSGATPFNTDSTAVIPITHKYAALTGGWTNLPDPAPTVLTSGGTTAPPAFGLVY